MPRLPWLTISRRSFPATHTHYNQQIQFPILEHRGHPGGWRLAVTTQEMHVTTAGSQKEPTQGGSKLVFHSLCLKRWGKKKKTFIIILLNKSLYFKKFLVFGGRERFLTWSCPKHPSEVKQKGSHLHQESL